MIGSITRNAGIVAAREEGNGKAPIPGEESHPIVSNEPHSPRVSSPYGRDSPWIKP